MKSKTSSILYRQLLQELEVTSMSQVLLPEKQESQEAQNNHLKAKFSICVSASSFLVYLCCPRPLFFHSIMPAE